MTHRDLPVLVAERIEPAAPALIPMNYVHPGLSLAQILSILRAYRVQILLIMLAVLAGTVVVLSLWPRTYTANVSMMVNYEVNDPQNGKELPIGLLGGYISTQIDLMQNPEVLLAVVDRMLLTRHKDYIEGYQEGRGTLREWAAKQVSKNLVIYQGQLGSQMIYVSYSAHNAVEAAHIANAIVDTYLSSTQIRSLKAQLAGQEVQMAKLLTTFAELHPQVVELQSQINETRRLIAATQAGENIDVNSTVSTTPAESYKPPRGQYANVSVVSRATPPGKAVKPKMLTGLALGAMAAFVLGLGIPLAYELFNRRVRCRDDLERHHGVPVLVEFNSLPMIRSMS